MKLSVVIPVYNVADFLPRCIKSVLAQDVSDLEIVLVDDCSTDNSGDICEKFSQEYKNTKVIHCEVNQGLSEARNIGIKHSSGDYITFIDSDDFIEKGTYGINLKILEENPDIKVLEYPVWDSYLRHSKACFNPCTSDYVIRNFDDWIADGGYSRSYAVNKIYKREIWRKFSFPPGKYFEDLHTTPYIIADSGRIITSPFGKYFYFRQNMSSITNQLTQAKQHDLLDGSIKLFNFLKLTRNYAEKELFVFYMGVVNIQILYKQLGGKILIPHCHYSFQQIFSSKLPFISKFKAVLLKLTGKSFYKIYRL